MPTINFELVKDFIDRYSHEGKEFSDNLSLSDFGEADASIKDNCLQLLKWLGLTSDNEFISSCLDKAKDCQSLTEYLTIATYTFTRSPLTHRSDFTPFQRAIYALYKQHSLNQTIDKVLPKSEVVDDFIKQVVKPLMQSQTLTHTIHQFSERGILTSQTTKQLFENTGKLRHLTEYDYFRIESTVAPEAGFQDFLDHGSASPFPPASKSKHKQMYEAANNEVNNPPFAPQTSQKISEQWYKENNLTTVATPLKDSSTPPQHARIDSDDTQGDIVPYNYSITSFSSSASSQNIDQLDKNKQKDSERQTPEAGIVQCHRSHGPSPSSRLRNPHSMTFFGGNTSSQENESNKPHIIKTRTKILTEITKSFIDSFKSLWPTRQQDQQATHGDNNIELQARSSQSYKSQRDQDEADALDLGGSNTPSK